MFISIPSLCYFFSQICQESKHSRFVSRLFSNYWVYLLCCRIHPFIICHWHETCHDDIITHCHSITLDPWPSPPDRLQCMYDCWDTCLVKHPHQIEWTIVLLYSILLLRVYLSKVASMVRFTKYNRSVQKYTEWQYYA